MTVSKLSSKENRILDVITGFDFVDIFTLIFGFLV